MPRRHDYPNPVEWFDSMAQDYRASKPSRFRPTIKGIPALGGSADYHYRNEADYLRMMESARAFDRDDVILGSTIDRAVGQTIQDGFTVDPETGDDAIDEQLAARWEDWAGDPQQVDITGQFTFTDYERLTLRANFVDGDIFVLPVEDGQLQAAEGHRPREPKRSKKNIVLGVELDSKRRRKGVWFTKDEINPLTSTQLRLMDLRNVPWYDEQGNLNVFHVYNPRRVTQTRGVTALAPIFDAIGMHNDIEFAHLVAAQVASAFAIIRNRQDFARPESGPMGEESTETNASGGTRVLEGIGPGMQFNAAPGETLTGFSPNIPNPEFFPHAKLILTFIGINLGVPLVMMLMDASETNFSGMRGAFDLARMGFRQNQGMLIRRLHRPVYMMKVRQWASEDNALASALARGVPIFKHLWQPPGFPHIQPEIEAAADLLQQRNGLNSPRRIQMRLGRTWEKVSQEIVEDNKAAIKLAIAAANEINAEVEDESQRVSWRDLISLPTPDGVSVSIDPGTPAKQENQPTAKNANANDAENRSRAA